MHTPDDSEKAKIQRIIANDLKHWEKLSHDELIELLVENRWYQLEEECAWGNSDYLDELLEEEEGV
jgi:hypothetical protein